MKSGYVNGLKIFCPKTRQELSDFAVDDKKILVAVNAEKILNATDESRNLVNKNIGYPDGFGAVWALRRKGRSDAVKIPGCELWLDIVKKYCNKRTFYLVGAKKEIIDKTVELLKQDYPGIKILGSRDGFIQNEIQKKNLIKEIKRLSPDIIFVAMGSPLQERLMEEMQKVHPATYQGLGGSFDIYTGCLKRAPRWFLNNNLEWFYRLVKQPFRIRRQASLVSFVIRTLLNRI